MGARGSWHVLQLVKAPTAVQLAIPAPSDPLFAAAAATEKTNLLFFTKGQPTEQVWYYEHPYPEGYKSYSKTKPMRISEFDAQGLSNVAWASAKLEMKSTQVMPVIAA